MSEKVATHKCQDVAVMLVVTQTNLTVNGKVKLKALQVFTSFITIVCYVFQCTITGEVLSITACRLLKYLWKAYMTVDVCVL